MFAPAVRNRSEPGNMIDCNWVSAGWNRLWLGTVLVGVLFATLGLAACGDSPDLPAAPTSSAAASVTTVPTAGLTTAVDIQQGQMLVEANGCLACHSVDGSDGVGPTWMGLFGKEEALADGGSVVVDEDYLRASIIDPDAQITEGFQAGLMPRTFAESLSAGDIEAIVAFIRSL